MLFRSVDAGAGWLLPQAELTPERLAGLLQGLDRTELQARAAKARALRQPGAVEAMVTACARLIEQKENSRT